ncbi:hypothetical protein D307_gp031 [Bacillus phage Bastille]|uniref:Uncharacterized protein n=1 Tax=Bacillus phage Bastille TaxID=57477 RepID=J9PL43_9CAUD|nr:hypothetical protein D307_gp031 [Bacillus phage Bastille]AEQ34433.1 hypothetical protein [Bacillus phage Bastille]AZF89132.1 hypothetical protein Goe5_c00240 [Bacillus phage vB_BthM-Goe5]
MRTYLEKQLEFVTSYRDIARKRFSNLLQEDASAAALSTEARNIYKSEEALRTIKEILRDIPDTFLAITVDRELDNHEILLRTVKSTIDGGHMNEQLYLQLSSLGMIIRVLSNALKAYRNDNEYYEENE